MNKRLFSKQFKGFSLLVIFSLSLVLTLEMVNINAISNNQGLPSNEQNQQEGDSFETLGSLMQRIDFLWSINPALKVNPGLLAIDKFSLLFYLDTSIKFTLDLPVIISISYPDSMLQGESGQMTVGLSSPDNQARWTLNISAQFILKAKLYIDLPVINTTFNFYREGNFTTPLGTQRTPFNLSLSQDFGIGELKLIGIPEFREVIKAAFENYSQFEKIPDLQWNTPAVKQVSLIVKTDAQTGETTISIGDWKYEVYLAIHWLTDFDFYSDELNDFVMDTFSTDLCYNLGVFPFYRILSIDSPVIITFPIQIGSNEPSGNTWETAIPVDPLDWVDNFSIYYSYEIWYEHKIYAFTAFKGWYYQFTLFTNGSNMLFAVYNESHYKFTEVQGNNGSLTVSFIPSEDGKYVVVTENIAMGPHWATIRTDLILYPGMEDYFPKKISYPYPGDYDTLFYSGDYLWYSFNASIGWEIIFWCYRFEMGDLIDLYLYYQNTSCLSAVSWAVYNDSIVSLRFVVNATGTYYLQLYGYDITYGDFWLDFCLFPVDYGNSPSNAVDLISSFTIPTLGPSVETWGGFWFKTDAIKKTVNNLTFSGSEGCIFEFFIVNSTDYSIIWNETCSGEISSYSFISFGNYDYYILIIPIWGGEYITINRTVSTYYYRGEIPSTAISVYSNSYFNSSFPVDWNGSYWINPSPDNFLAIYLNLTSFNASNIDLFLYDKTGTVLMNKSILDALKEVRLR